MTRYRFQRLVGMPFFTAFGGTGDLANLHGQGTFVGTGAAGAHTLRITFAP